MEDVRAIEVIKTLRAEAISEIEPVIQQLQEQVDELQQENIRLSQKLEPLLQFESVLDMEIKKIVPINLFELTETEQKYLEALARKTYPRLASNNDQQSRKPLNQLFTDLTKKLVDGAGQYTMTEFQRLIVDRFFTVRDG